MHYYIFDEISPNPYAPYIELPDEIDLIETLKGDKGEKPDFEELPIKVPVEIEEGEEIVYGDILNPGVPFFSTKMKDTLASSGVENIDYYPVVLVDAETKEPLCDYWLAVIKDVVACIDHEKSEFKENIFEKIVLTRFAIDPSRTKGLPLLRLHNIPGLMIIDEGLKEKFSACELSGVSIKHTSEYHREVD